MYFFFWFHELEALALPWPQIFFLAKLSSIAKKFINETNTELTLTKIFEYSTVDFLKCRIRKAVLNKLVLEVSALMMLDDVCIICHLGDMPLSN